MTDYMNQGTLTGSSSPFKSAEDVRLTSIASRHITENYDELDTDIYDEVDNVDYRFEEARLKSFKNWPISFMKPEILAASGFYFTGHGDKVKCFECKVEICKWVESDSPQGEHQRWSGRCRFLRNIPCGNVPIGTDPENVPPPSPRSVDVCGPYDPEVRVQSSPDSHTFRDAKAPLYNPPSLSCLGIARPKGPAHREFASYDARLNSFEAWPKSISQTKEQLADAGFFYTEKGDQTLCYYCGGGLKDWAPEDDPWEEHAKWFSKCYYLLTVKGQEYVNQITNQPAATPFKEESQLSASHIKTLEKSLKSDSGTSLYSEDSGIESPGCSPKSSHDSIIDTRSKATNSKSTDDATLCKICYNAELGVVFLPCGHIIACVKCAPGMTTCAICRRPVNMTVRAFLS